MVYKHLEYVIRLQRSGRIRRPFWRIVVQKKLYGIKRAPICILGTFNNFHGNSRFKNSKYKRFYLVFLNYELLNFWLIKGARPTNRVENIIF